MTVVVVISVVSVPVPGRRSSVVDGRATSVTRVGSVWRGTHAPPAAVVWRHLLPPGVNGLNQGGLVKQDDAGLAVLGIAGILKVAKVDISYALVGLLHDTHVDVPVLLVLPVERLADDVVAGLGMQLGDAEHLVATSGRGRAHGPAPVPVPVRGHATAVIVVVGRHLRDQHWTKPATSQSTVITRLARSTVT